MNENELMIGNQVISHCADGSSIIMEVTGIKPPHIFGVYQGRKTWNTLDRIEPIPLTHDILSKVGFEQLPKLYVHVGMNSLCKSVLFMEYNLSNGCLFINDCMVTRPVRFFHELQNIFRVYKIEMNKIEEV